MISAIITHDLGDYHTRSRRLSHTISAIIIAHACVARKLYAPKEMKAISAIISHDLGDYLP